MPQRVNGKVLGNLNGIDLNNIDLHTYVVTSDGRAYTAISRVEPKLGTSMLSLYTIGSVFGWLYGALTTANGKNGYSVTGDPYYPTEVSHSVSFWLIWFINRRVLYNHALSVVHRRASPSLSTEWVDYVEEPIKYQALRPQFFSMGGWGVVGWLVVGWVVVCGVIRLSFQSNSNSQKLSLWCKKKKSLPTQMDLYDPYMVSYRIS